MLRLMPARVACSSHCGFVPVCALPDFPCRIFLKAYPFCFRQLPFYLSEIHQARGSFFPVIQLTKNRGYVRRIGLKIGWRM